MMNQLIFTLATASALFFGAAAVAHCAPPETPAQQRVSTPEPPRLIRARDAVDRLREDFRMPLSFIEADEEVRIDVPHTATSKEILDALTASGAYRLEVIDGSPVLADASERWKATVTRVAVRNTPRMTAMRAYVLLVKQQVPALSMLRRPGVLGTGVNSETYEEPFNDERVTLTPEGRVIDHFVQLLGGDPQIVFDVRQFTWGTRTAMGIVFEAIAPLAFTERPRFDAFNYYHRIAGRAGFAWNEERMHKALSHERAAVRAAAVHYFGLWQRKNSADAPRLRKMLGDPSLPVRLMAAEALLALGDRSGLSTVTSAALHQEDRELRIAAVRGSAAFAVVAETRKAALETLAKTLADPEAEIRLVTATALSAIAGDDVRELLKNRAAVESDPAVRAVLTKALEARTKS